MSAFCLSVEGCDGQGEEEEARLEDDLVEEVGGQREQLRPQHGHGTVARHSQTSKQTK